MMAVSMGLPFSMGSKLAMAAENAKKRPPVIWIHGQECTGCTETLLRSNHPDVGKLILELISLDYHETLSAGAGFQAEDSLKRSMNENKGGYILVVEGATPTKDGGIYCKVGGRPFIDIFKENRGTRGGGDRHRVMLRLGRRPVRRPESHRFRGNP